MHLAKPAGFLRVSLPVYSSVFDKMSLDKKMRLILYIVHKTLWELCLDPQRASESPGKLYCVV